MPTLSMPNIQFPKFDLTAIDFSKIQLPKPDVDLPDVDFERIAGFARDAAYVGVGLAVLGVQQVQVRRRELATAVSERLEQAGDTARELFDAASRQVKSIVS